MKKKSVSKNKKTVRNKPFLIYYSGKNISDYVLVNAKTQQEAIEKVREARWFINNLFVECKNL